MSGPATNTILVLEVAWDRLQFSKEEQGQSIQAGSQEETGLYEELYEEDPA